jgi:hypothetical protein
MMKQFWLLPILLFLFTANFVHAQDEGGSQDLSDYSYDAGGYAENGDFGWDAGNAAMDPYGASFGMGTGQELIPEPPRGYRTVSLGMDIDNLKEVLQEDETYQFRGDRDVSFLPIDQEDLIETSGTSFVQRAAFQLRDGSLYIFTLTLNTRLVDHYSVFTTFVQRYGQPSYLDPKEAIWESEATRVSIERPLTVKYIDKERFNDMLFNSRVIESREVQQREDFLNGF